MPWLIVFRSRLKVGFSFPMIPVIPFIVGMMLVGCLSTGSSPLTYGIQPGFEGYVPARIGILPCQLWPKSTHFEPSTRVNADQDALTMLCSSLDREVLNAFERQPFMRGLTPKAVRRALEPMQLARPLDQLAELWSLVAPGCGTVRSAAECYVKHLSGIPQWNVWLSDASKAARHADAFLIPLVSDAREEKLSRRGLYEAQREIQLDLLLISTSRGTLIWAGGQKVQEGQKRLAGKKSLESLVYPEWENLLSLALNSNLWRDFPGKQMM